MTDDTLDTLTVGLIGCGEITSKRRADNFDAATNVEIGAAMDVEADAAADIGERFGVPHTTNQEDVLSNPAIDAVYVATPHHLHAPQTIGAAEAGKHVLCEKPIATSLKEADEMLAACERHGVALSVCLPSRYRPSVLKARELVADGAIGEVVGTRIQVMGVKPDSYWEGGYTGRVESDWRQSQSRSGGGVLNMNAIHDIDAVRSIVDLDAERVYAEYDTFATPVEVEDFCAVTIRYENGAIGTVETSSFLESGPRPETLRGNRIYGTKGELVVGDSVRARTTEDTALGESGTWHEVPVSAERPAGVRVVEEFAAAAAAGGTPPVTGADGRTALEVVRAAYRSGEERAPVTLPLER